MFHIRVVLHDITTRNAAHRDNGTLSLVGEDFTPLHWESELTCSGEKLLFFVFARYIENIAIELCQAKSNRLLVDMTQQICERPMGMIRQNIACCIWKTLNNKQIPAPASNSRRSALDECSSRINVCSSKTSVFLSQANVCVGHQID